MMQNCIAVPGEPGDCYRACVASILGLTTQEVPNFHALSVASGAHGDKASLLMQQMVRDFLRPRGLAIFQTYCCGDWPLEEALQHFSGENPGVPVIFNGQPKHSNDDSHAVIALDGKIIHDPSGAGIIGPNQFEKTSWWFAEVITVALPTPSSGDNHE
jgi:hypothetical protein